MTWKNTSMTKNGENRMVAKESNPYMPKSKSDVHITPRRVWEMIESTWGHKKTDFYDPCPLNPQQDGLTLPWTKLNFVNPPYGQRTNPLLMLFVVKAHYETRWEKNETILLLPAKTDQDWFHDYILEPGYEILWIRKRLKFEGEKSGATQPHFLVRMTP
jgi:hypothetical protein